MSWIAPSRSWRRASRFTNRRRTRARPHRAIRNSKWRTIAHGGEQRIEKCEIPALAQRNTKQCVREVARHRDRCFDAGKRGSVVAGKIRAKCRDTFSEDVGVAHGAKEIGKSFEGSEGVRGP